jgi:hypothetical protein
MLDALYGCETWLLTVSEEHTFVFENNAQKIFELGGASRVWERKIHAQFLWENFSEIYKRMDRTSPLNDLSDKFLNL